MHKNEQAVDLVSKAGATLITFLEEDGHVLFKTGEQLNQRKLDCVSALHHDDQQSMRVDPRNGTYQCTRCGIFGNALSYLRQHRDLCDQDAFAVLKKEGWPLSKIKRADAQDKEALPSGLQWVETIPDIFPEERLRKHAEYAYRSGTDIVMTRVVYASNLGIARRAAPSMTFAETSLLDSIRSRRRSLTFSEARSRGGGYWVCDAIDAALPAQDRKVAAYPLYRIDDALSRLDQGEHSGIWLVPDERVCELVCSVEDHPKGPIPCTCLYKGERTRILDHDIEPLAGKRVLLISNREESSRYQMTRLGHELGQCDVDCTLCLMPGNSGESIVDVIERDGTQGLRDWLSNAGVEKNKPTPTPTLTPDPDAEIRKDTPNAAAQPRTIDPDGASIENNPHFSVLGLMEDAIAMRSKRTQQLHFVPMNLLANEAHLLPLAPLSWWLRCADAENALSPDQRIWLSDRITQAAGSKGMYQVPDAVLGRGAFAFDDGKDRNVGFNLGDRLLLPGADGLLTREAPLDALEAELLPGCPLALHDDPQAEDFGRALVEAVMAYRWADKAHGKAFLGWIVASLVAGAMRYRPALWIAAGPGSGKTYLMDLLDEVFGPSAVSYFGVMQPDGRGLALADSLPCLVDQLDRERAEQQWERARELLGQITAGRGRMARVGLPRCAFIFAARKPPPLTAAESQRVLILRFGKPVADWPGVDEPIVQATRPHKMLALRTRIIRHAPRIVAKAGALEHAQLRSRSKGSATREAQLLGALNAGYGFLSGEDALIRRTDDVVSDEHTILELLLCTRVKTEHGESNSIAELVTANESYKRAIAAEYGFKMVEQGLAIAHKHEKLRELLEATPYCESDFRASLNEIGAKAWTTLNGNPGRINSGGRRHVCRLVPGELLNEIGLETLGGAHD